MNAASTAPSLYDLLDVEPDACDEQILAAWRTAIAGLEHHGGPVVAGRPANLCVIDPAATWEVDAARLASRSHNTPYTGRTLTGRVRHRFARTSRNRGRGRVEVARRRRLDELAGALSGRRGRSRRELLDL